MLPLETLGAFFVTAIVMGLAPGPDNIFVLTQSALYGFRAGIVTTLGLMTGALRAYGSRCPRRCALFQTSEMAFTVLKCAGAAYLLYLAWLSFRSGCLQGMAGAKYISRILGPVSAGCDHEHYQSQGHTFLSRLPSTVCQAGTRECPASDRHPWPPLPARYAGRLRRRFIPWAGRLAEWFNASIRGQIILNRITACIFTALALLLIFSSR